jgi:hypothetical protein
MKHSAGIEKFGVKLEAAALPRQRAKVVDAAGVIEQQSRLRIANENRDLVAKFAVGNADPRDKCCLRSLS